MQRTWVFVDNLDSFLCTEYLSDFVSACISRARMRRVVYYGSIYHIAETFSDSWPGIRKIMNNIQNVAILSVPPYDRAILKETYDISEELIKKIASSKPGEGIVSTKKGFVPFNVESEI